MGDFFFFLVFRILCSPTYCFSVWVCVCVCAQSLNRVQLFVTLWIVVPQSPLSVGFSRQDFWSEWVAISSSRASLPRSLMHACGTEFKFLPRIPYLLH